MLQNENTCFRHHISGGIKLYNVPVHWKQGQWDVSSDVGAGINRPGHMLFVWVQLPPILMTTHYVSLDTVRWLLKQTGSPASTFRDTLLYCVINRQKIDILFKAAPGFSFLQ